MSDMEEFAELVRRILKVLEGFTPEQVQKMLDQVSAQIQVMTYLETKAEKRIHLLTRLMMLVTMNNLRKTWNNRYENRPVTGVF